MSEEEYNWLWSTHFQSTVLGNAKYLLEVHIYVEQHFKDVRSFIMIWPTYCLLEDIGLCHALDDNRVSNRHELYFNGRLVVVATLVGSYIAETSTAFLRETL